MLRGKTTVIYGMGGAIDGARAAVTALVNPVALGRGRPLFPALGDRLALRLLKTRAFSSGVVGLRYEKA